MIARRTLAAGVVLAMLAMVVPAIVIPIERGALGGLFPADLGAAVAFASVGAFLLLRGNSVIAAIMCVQGLTASATVFCGVLRDDAATRGPLHGAVIWAAWADNLVWLPGVTLLVPLLLLLPDGRLAWRHSRWPIVVTGVFAGFFVVVSIGRRGSLVDGRPTAFAPNPTAFFTGISDGVLDVVATLVFVGFVLMIAVSLGALIARRRRATGVERAQLTSLLYGGALTVGLIAINQVLDSVVGSTWWTFVLGLVAIGPIPVAIAVAVRRYRLYEIDKVVSRTVAYACVVTVLAAVYVGVLSALAALVPSDYGQVGVAAATLAVAVLAVPLTRRVRGAVDHRFNRRRLDSERLVVRFAERTRRDDDHVRTQDELLRTVAAVVEPAHAGLWMVPR